MCSLTCLVCTRPAHAQWATTSYPNSGTLTYGSKPAVPWNASSYYDFSVGPKAENGSISLSGSVSAILQWQGRGTAPPANQQQLLPVLITVGVGASDSSNSDSGGSTFAVSDGFEDAQVPDTMAVDNYYNGGVMSYGKHLVQAQVSQGAGGIWQATVSATSLSAIATSAGLAEAVSAEYLVQADTRAVSISSNFDPTLYKCPITGQTDANGDPVVVKMAHVPASDGTMSGDIGLPWGYDEPSTYNYSPVTYHATASGDWVNAEGNFDGNEYNWFSSLKQSGDSGTLSPSDAGIPDFTNEYAEPIVDQVTQPATITAGETGQTDHIHLTYTDSGGDGAVATANYYMTLHKPEEFSKSNKSTVLVPGLPANCYYQPMTLNPAYPGYAVCPGGIACTWDAPGAYWNWGSDALSIMSNSGPVWFQDFLTAAGIAYSKLEPQPYNGTAPWAWGQAASTFPAGYPKGSEPQSCYHMIPMLNELYEMQYTLDDHYDTGGYEGTGMIASSTDEGPSEWYGNFVYFVH